MPTLSRTLLGATLASLLLGAPAAWALAPQDAHGLWLSADKAAIIEFKECADTPGALCGQIVWEKDASSPDNSCGLRIAKLKRWDDTAWRDGWVHDPRNKKTYKGAVRVKGPILAIRAFIGTEMLGETEELTRAEKVPADCSNKLR